jgi:hypothetical protein
MPNILTQKDTLYILLCLLPRYVNWNHARMLLIITPKVDVMYMLCYMLCIWTVQSVFILFTDFVFTTSKSTLHRASWLKV